jgi:hypothetical protein
MSTHVEPRGARAAAASVWPLERMLFALAGTVTLVSVVLAVVVSTWWLLLTVFVGANQLAFVAFGDCIASLVLRRAFGVRRGCLR